MKTTLHEFEPTHFHVTMGSHEPVLRVRSGDIDPHVDGRLGRLRQARQNDITEGGNPQTGPFYLEGAEPGDTLARALRLHPPEPQARRHRRRSSRHTWSTRTSSPSCGERSGEDWWTLDLERRHRPPRRPAARARVARRAAARPDARLLRRRAAAAARRSRARPPASTAATWTTAASARASTVYFPVFAEGALFHLGDGHALQGDGEIVGTGIEVSMDVEFTARAAEGQDDPLAARGRRRPS